MALVVASNKRKFPGGKERVNSTFNGMQQTLGAFFALVPPSTGGRRVAACSGVRAKPCKGAACIAAAKCRGDGRWRLQRGVERACL
ncbi:hypothetical protein [Paenibacillus sp. FSL R5-808]|uniref:hypothetical protein n=1 Tax=Paenibacillus sp. FSL R5-808 TaxID=1227076 RepID=UPI0003E1D6E3|nr:hypothetical protein [Paenibacillus sp. FSL R5-808]ETT32895.1 hypothetical protein C169_23015 [Paenibacillus sp. FSL R5-808]